MIILHCMPKSIWESVHHQPHFGEASVAAEGFVHCSSIEYFWRVAPNFRNVDAELLLLCIDTDLLRSEIRWEDADNCGREYPHVYGPINLNAVVATLPFLRDEHGEWVKNEELCSYPNL